MAVLILVLFPLLLLFNPPLAAGALVTAIVLLYRGKSRRASSQYSSSGPTDDASI
jgi:hypothetical protein